VNALKYYITGFLFLLAVQGLWGQSRHFSQFYSVPVVNNPAFTGTAGGTFRVSASFRSQWAQGSDPYLTKALSADFRILNAVIPNGAKAGLSGYFINDQSMGGAYTKNQFGAAIGYHVPLVEEGISTLGASLQPAFHQQRIDYGRLSYENQFGNTGYDPSLPVGESLPADSRSYFDLNAGLVFNYDTEELSFLAGLSGHNLIQRPDNNRNTGFQAPVRYSFMAGGRKSAGFAGNLYASMNIMYQAAAATATAGAAFGYLPGADLSQEISAGLYYRLNDAIIPYIGYEIRGFKFGFTYDYTISSLKGAGTERNAYELSLIYQHKNKGNSQLIPWY
jgi:type IX secretion system PorP/SprF family membrane protein